MESIERALEIFERYATADRDRKVGAVTYVDPLTTEPELVDAHTARVCYRRLERALQAAQLGSADAERYLVSRERLLASPRPEGMRQVDDTVCRGQKLEGDAIAVSPWMIQAFAKAFHHANTITENASNAHGFFSVCHTLASLGRRLAAYAVESLEAHFRVPVYFGDSLTPLAEVQETWDGGKAVLRFRAVNQDGAVVCEGTATLRPEKPGDLLPTPPAELQWLRQWAEDVTPRVQAAVYDFTDPEAPRQQTFAKPVTPELGRATQALFGPLYPHQVSPLLALGTMAMTSTESSPGHLLLTARVLHFRGPIEAGEELSLMVTAPSPDQIRHSQNGKGNSIVPLDITLTNERGALILQGQVVTLRAES
jgi:acyl-CoA thioesterase FadM